MRYLEYSKEHSTQTRIYLQLCNVRTPVPICVRDPRGVSGNVFHSLPPLSIPIATHISFPIAACFSPGIPVVLPVISRHLSGFPLLLPVLDISILFPLIPLLYRNGSGLFVRVGKRERDEFFTGTEGGWHSGFQIFRHRSGRR